MFPKAPPVVGADWITTPPLDEQVFRGRASIVLFWSIGCEASRVRLLELDALSNRLPRSLNVVAVHSPRFAYEREVSAVADMVTRIGLTTPVVHDPDLLTWARYDPGGWPAAIVVDHRGRALGASMGLDDLRPLVEAAEMANLGARRGIERANRANRRSGRKTSPFRSTPPAPTPLPEAILPYAIPPASGLAWPSGLAVLPADENGRQRLAVADSGHSRVLVLALDESQRTAQLTGAFERLVGVGSVCATSTSTLAASLPDGGNVVELDLANSRVITLAEGLERPTGLTTDVDGSIVVADAGDNQLVRILPNGLTGVVAGCGFLGTTDGKASRAALAQPVALSRTPRGMAFLDAATSNLRLLTDRSEVRSVTHNSVDNFGLVDGPVHQASLQRPSDLVSLTNGDLAIADTGNSRIRVLNKRRLRTLGLTGLRHPEALTVLRQHDGCERVAVADTANHRIVIATLDTQEAWELELPSLD